MLVYVFEFTYLKYLLYKSIFENSGKKDIHKIIIFNILKRDFVILNYYLHIEVENEKLKNELLYKILNKIRRMIINKKFSHLDYENYFSKLLNLKIMEN